MLHRFIGSVRVVRSVSLQSLLAATLVFAGFSLSPSLSVAGGAAALGSGRDEALRVCDAMSSPGWRNNCREIVAKSQTFSLNAVQACGAMTMDSRKNDCLLAITDRAYDDSEVASCRKESFESRVIDCLKLLGREVSGNFELRQQIAESIRWIQRGRSDLAERQLLRLLDSLGGEPSHP